MCNLCASPLKNSKYYEVICRDARDHDKEERVDDLQKEKKDEEESRRSEEHDKEKKPNDIARLSEKLDELEKKLEKAEDLTESPEELELLESLRAEVHELKEQLNKDDEKQSKQAEFIGVHNYQSASIDGDDAIDQLQTLQRYRHRQKKSKHGVGSYSVLTLKPYESVSGDSLFIKMGSTDSDSVSDTSGDKLLKSLGSVD